MGLEEIINKLDEAKELEDWHLANSEMMFDTFVEPARTSQQSYAYA